MGKLLNPEVRDSVANVQLKNFESGKDALTDPEKYIDDPAEYMMKKHVYK